MSTVALTGLAGCGSAETPAAANGKDANAAATQKATGPHAEAVLKAYEQTAKSGSAKVTFEQVTQVQDSTVQLRGSGPVSFADGTMRITLAGGQGQGVAMRKLDGFLYMKLPESRARQLPTGKTWIELDLSKVGKKGYGPKYAKMKTGIATHPTTPLTYVRGATSVTKVGTATVNGTSTTHYEAMVNLATLRDRGAPAASNSLQSALGSDKLPVDIWLDQKGRIRQERISFEFPSRERTATTELTITLAEFGTPVDVAMPPRAQIAKASAITPAGK